MKAMEEVESALENGDGAGSGDDSLFIQVLFLFIYSITFYSGLNVLFYLGTPLLFIHVIYYFLFSFKCTLFI